MNSISHLQLHESKDETSFIELKNELNEPNKEDEGKQQKQSEILLEILHENGAELFHDEQKIAYCTFKRNNHFETWAIHGEIFSSWITSELWKTQKKAASRNALDEAIKIMSGIALNEGKCFKVFTRIGYLDGKYYLNLADENWRVIEITSKGWKILDDSPIKFVGTKNMKALPCPLEMGDINLLFNHINIPENARKLIITWIIDSYLIDTNFTLLMLTGVYGSAKSTTQAMIRRVIDPSISNLRTPPCNADDIAISATNNFLVSYNNISHLNKQNQDILCCIASGGGFAKRTLFTTNEETVIDIKRPIIMNGIHNCIYTSDLLSRCIVVELQPIHEKQRKSDIEIENNFITDQGKILGGILNALSGVINTLPTIILELKTRMADFCLLGTALERVLGWEKESFMSEYRANHSENTSGLLESSPVAVALQEFMRNKSKVLLTFAEVLRKLDKEKKRNNSHMIGWPTTGKKLANILKELTHGLEIVGIKLNFNFKRSNKGMLVEIINLNRQSK